MSMLFRCATLDDLPAIHHLAMQSGVGMTTLPKDKSLLSMRLSQSQAAFQSHITQPGNEYYFFVLEDPSTHHIAGTAAIEALTGSQTPFYSYKHHACIKTCTPLSIQSKQDHLILTHENEGHSEVCTLYLEPMYRKHGNGLLLSLARFLFMAHFPTRFAPRVIADMRGVSDEQGHSPFWNAVGELFFHMPFADADQLTLASNKQFIADLMPEYPIYLNLLPIAAQAVIGQPHPSTKPAVSILTREGFQYNHTVDIFDAGPTLEIKRDRIRTIAQSQLMTVNIAQHPTHHQRVLLANTSLDFRSTLSTATLNESNNTCYLTRSDADLLQLNNEDFVRISIT